MSAIIEFFIAVLQIIDSVCTAVASKCSNEKKSILGMNEYVFWTLVVVAIAATVLVFV